MQFSVQCTERKSDEVVKIFFVILIELDEIRRKDYLVFLCNSLLLGDFAMNRSQFDD